LSSACKNYVVECVKIAWYIHLNKKEGDILVFLTGQEEIEIFLSILNQKYELEKKKYNNLFKILCLPLYAGLNLENQMAVFDQAPKNTSTIFFSFAFNIIIVDLKER
jgi:HrpA-like RNA helicase